MEFRTLGEVTSTIFSGGTPNTRKAELWNGDINWLSSGETRNRFITKTEKKITQKGVENSSTRMAKVNDLVIASAGQGYTRGQTSFCLIDTYINQSVIALRANEDIILPLFLFYNLSSRYNELRAISDSHSSRGSLTSKLLRDLPIQIPTIKEQQFIVNILYKIDQKIELNNGKIYNLEQISRILFKRWFVNFEHPNERGEPYKSSGGEMVESDLGTIPRGWKVITLAEATKTIIDHRGKTPKKLGGDWKDKGFKSISAKNVKENRLVNLNSIKFLNEELYEKWMKEELEKGDILLTSEGPLGEMYFLAEEEKYCLSQRLFGIRSDSSLIFPEILFLFMNSKAFKDELLSRATGSTVQGIRQAELRKINVLIPDIQVQNKSMIHFRPILLKVYNLQKQNNNLIRLRDTLLPKLYAGEIELPDETEVNEFVSIQ